MDFNANKHKVLHSYQNKSNSNNDWFFGAITRSEAENVLIGYGLSEGLFLVRQSMSSPGDYVLSCVHKGLIAHYQIQRLGDDPLFRLSDGIAVHGLDQLIDQFRDATQPESRCLSLEDHCRGSQPPPETLRHGRSNLLHRSVAAGDRVVVSELLNSDTPYNLEARDERGRTALHLAVELDEEKHLEIVRQLIRTGANVDCRDSESITPLHLCAKLNKHKFARLLVIEAKAKTFVRATGEGWVALHMAADNGNAEVMEVLLRSGAAPQPRSTSDETPTQLAIKRNARECEELCQSYANRPIDHLEATNQWLCDQLSAGYQIDKLLASLSHSGDGTFLVRKSRSQQNTYVLAMAHNRKVYNFQIQYNNGFYFIDSGPYWPSLEHLIWYHKRNSDGLPSRLSAPLLSVINTSINETLIEINTQNNKDSESDANNECIKSILFIDGSQLRIGPLIGSGEYADVYRGYWNHNYRQTTAVAIKILKNRDFRDIETRFDKFVKEIEVMTTLRHPHIARLLGVCVAAPLMMVQEFAALGSVRDFLISHPSQVPQHIKVWSIQIAEGMQFLERRHLVHRDLAARNVLVFSLSTVKITDFGLSRALKSDEEVYASSSGDRWPLRWFAPESLKYGTFSHATDVWSFGVLLWEMYSSGDEPFADIDNSLIVDYIEDGKRLAKPEECSDSAYGLMCFCWAHSPKNRPTFSQIVKLMLTNDSTYESMRNELKSAIEMGSNDSNLCNIFDVK